MTLPYEGVRLTAFVSGSFPWDRVAKLVDGLSSAEITLVAQDTVKEMFIEDHDAITLSQFELAIADRHGLERTGSARH